MNFGRFPHPHPALMRDPLACPVQLLPAVVLCLSSRGCAPCLSSRGCASFPCLSSRGCAAYPCITSCDSGVDLVVSCDSKLELLLFVNV